MATGRMHEDEVETDAALVGRLLRAQFPRWACLPIARVESAGTDNAIYRLGEDKAVRLPRIHWAVDQVDKEREWIPRLAPHLPLEVTRPLAWGEPGEGYPWRWAIHQWLAGDNLCLDQLADPCETAIELARFLRVLRRLDATGGPLATESSRGAPLATRDRRTREAIAAMRGMIDAAAATTAWEAALRAPGWDRAPVWFHGDLLPGNLLFERGRLSAVIDFGGLGVGDPACDWMIAWGLFSGESREAFRVATEVDEATWARARGHALSQAVIFIPYYLDTNPEGVRNARRQLGAVLAEPGVDG